MKQNSKFSYVSEKINSKKGVEGNAPCSLIVKEEPPPKRTKCHSIAKVRIE